MPRITHSPSTGRICVLTQKRSMGPFKMTAAPFRSSGGGRGDALVPGRVTRRSSPSHSVRAPSWRRRRFFFWMRRWAKPKMKSIVIGPPKKESTAAMLNNAEPASLASKVRLMPLNTLSEWTPKPSMTALALGKKSRNKPSEFWLISAMIWGSRSMPQSSK